MVDFLGLYGGKTGIACIHRKLHTLYWLGKLKLHIEKILINFLESAMI